ncbi:sulfatase-like hydrolase/transferase [Streptomyces erythrochromogenes]|uniref:sulfatase-like hydrolase/transferase n=1 Tax=Streptomyces erythrochromogenes TaxID=285574 RepID=UPI0036C57E3A
MGRDTDLIGGPRSLVHHPRGWGLASNTPFRLYKGQTHAGGVRVPFVISWPDGLRRGAGDTGIRQQYQYVTDITPTLLELAGVPRPSRWRARPAQEPDGVSIAPVLHDRRGEGAGRRPGGRGVAQRGLPPRRRQRRPGPAQSRRGAVPPPPRPARGHTGAGTLAVLPAHLLPLLRRRRRRRTRRARRVRPGRTALARRPGRRLQPVRRRRAAGVRLQRVQRVQRAPRDRRGAAGRGPPDGHPLGRRGGGSAPGVPRPGRRRGDRPVGQRPPAHRHGAAAGHQRGRGPQVPGLLAGPRTPPQLPPHRRPALGDLRPGAQAPYGPALVAAPCGRRPPHSSDGEPMNPRTREALFISPRGVMCTADEIGIRFRGSRYRGR